MAERIDPKYADVVAALKRAQAARRGRDGSGGRPVRGFLLPAAK